MKQQNLNLSKDTFVTIGGVKGKQFGKDVYSTVLKFKDLQDFINVFPNVQRKISPRKVRSIKRYILSGLSEEGSINVSMRFFSALTATCRGNIFFDDDKQRVAIDTRSKLSLNDGQHRFAGINEAIIELEDLYIKTKEKEKASRIAKMRDELKEMIIPIVIFDNMMEAEEKQLFYDLNNLASRPSRSANIRLAQTDIVAKMAREVSEENKYLKYYGVEMDKMSIQFGNKNTVLLTTIYSIIRELFDVDYITNKNYREFKNKLNEFLDMLFYNLPPDINIKGKYLTEKSYTLRGIVKFIIDARRNKHKDEDIFRTIKNTDFSMDISKWSIYGGKEVKYGGRKYKDSNVKNIAFGGQHESIMAIYSALMDNLEGKGVKRNKLEQLKMDELELKAN